MSQPKCVQSLQWCCNRLVVVAVLLLLPSSTVQGSELRLWRPVVVSLDKITAYNTSVTETHSISQGVSPKCYCSFRCAIKDWCKLWCVDSSNTNCIISNIIIMPTYIEQVPTNTIQCHTNRPKDFATNAVITAGKQDSSKHLRVKENLVDGIYGYYKEESFLTKTDWVNRWFNLHFGKPVKFQHVIVHVERNSHAADTFKNVEVRVGNVSVTGPQELFTYTMFERFIDGATNGQIIEMQSPKPVVAQFLSLYKYKYNSNGLLVAHIEVY